MTTHDRQYALIIGIDNYQNHKRLLGAVADADDFEAYLCDSLGVPKSNIINLRNKAATRNGIISGFQALQNNPYIEQGGSIFLYYAGHGSTMQVQGNMDEIQVILSHDTTADAQNQTGVPPIPYRTIIALLEDIARQRDCNITAIFDCGYTLPSRARDAGGFRARVVVIQGLLMPSLDQDIIPQRVPWSTPTTSQKPQSRPHVRLTACAEKEAAWENYGRGVFTKALLDILRDDGKPVETYGSLMNYLSDLPDQKPCCQGLEGPPIPFKLRKLRDPLAKPLVSITGTAIHDTESPPSSNSGGVGAAIRIKQLPKIPPSNRSGVGTAIHDTELPKIPPSNSIEVAYTHERIQIFALIIGIDRYRDPLIRSLRGAVADAMVVTNYLGGTLAVPAHHITTLLDGRATRTAIIQSFLRLGEDFRISRDDGILIYFAGHAGTVKAPVGWSASEDEIQCIFPHDYNVDLNNGQRIRGIPHRTINALLERLAQQKGNNITFVTDAILSPDLPDDGVARFMVTQDDLPSVVDGGNISSRDSMTSFVIDEKKSFRGLRSHVHLTACGPGEVAREVNGRGAFTQVLIQALMTLTSDKVTYRELVAMLPKIPGQHPSCIGYYTDRFLFNAKPYAFPLFNIKKEGDISTLMAGEAHGITLGSRFTVSADDNVNSIPDGALYTMSVTRVEATRATLECDPKFNLQDRAYARQISYGNVNLKVHFASRFDENVVKEISTHGGPGTGEMSPLFSVTEEKDNADLLVDIENRGGDRVTVFWVMIHGSPLRLGLDIRTPSVPDITRVLRLAAHWNFHFKRQSRIGLKNYISLEFYRLEEAYEEFEMTEELIWKPVGPNLNHEDDIKVNVNPNQRFGVKIFNKSKFDFYANLFYFDVKNQGIELCGMGALNHESHFTVGYDASGAPPFQFVGKEDEVGFYKVFLTTINVPSATLTRPLKGVSQAHPPGEAQWYTFSVKIMQRIAQ